MFQIGNTIISREVLEEHFLCDLNACKGACCVEGDSGAPLEEEEGKFLEQLYEKIKPYLRQEGIEAIEEQGMFVKDDEGETTTPLVKTRECAYVVFENGIVKCGIEKAYLEGKIDFRKPISCHLYPIRVKKYRQFEAINYHEWQICNAAKLCGKKAKLKLYEFLKEPLIRKYGEEWYNDLLELIRMQI